MSRHFDGKSVFITGASSGIGEALALELAERGGRVVLAARRLDRLEQIRETIENEGGEALSVVCDVTDRASIDEAVAQAVERFGGIDIVVANAGFGVSGTFEKVTTDDFRRQFDVNFFGVIDTIHAVLPHLKKSKGHLGIVASVLGRVGTPATSPYCSSKFALCGLAESIYYDLAEKGVSVTCINPGVVESDFRMTDNMGVFHEDRTDPVSKWVVVPRERAAREIADALEKRRFEAIITGHGKVIAFVARHFPRTFRMVTRLATRGKLDDVEKMKRAQPRD